MKETGKRREKRKREDEGKRKGIESTRREEEEKDFEKIFYMKM